jgi:hypothetical protein
MHDYQRSRFVYKQWARDPAGALLPRNPPLGKRPANGLIWGHTINDFFWMQRLPGVNVMTIWSRSMIQDFGENYSNEEHDFEPTPIQCQPYSVLRFPHEIIEDSYKGFKFPSFEEHLARGCVYIGESTYNKGDDTAKITNVIEEDSVVPGMFKS